MLTGIGCVLAAMLLYAMAAMLWGVGDDEFDAEERPGLRATLRP